MAGPRKAAPVADTEPAVADKPKATSAPVFDPGKPHGTVMGGDRKAVYFQDGVYFDSQGKPCSVE